MKDKFSLKLTVPNIVLIGTTLIGVLSYFYSLDKRVSIVEQDVVHVRQDIVQLTKEFELDLEQQRKQMDRVEDQVNKIYSIMVEKNSQRRIALLESRYGRKKYKS